MSEHFDVVILGAGPGGYIAALKAAQLGASVAVIEKHYLGGTCLNYGCIPSKALLSSAELLHHIHHSTDWGIKAGEVSFDWPAIQKRKDKVISGLRGGIGSLFKGRKVTLFTGTGKLAGVGNVAITSADGKTKTITGQHIILATGSSPIRIPGWPEDPQLVCTSDEAVHWKDLPKRLLIVGGGVIGCEFACMAQAFGVEVTIVEMLPRLLAVMDADLGAELQKTFKKRGIVCHVDTKVNEMKLAGPGQVRAVLSSGITIEVDRVLVATGRKPNTKDLGLETVGIVPNARGFIAVDDFMQTPVKGYYCIGDANGRCLLAHAASAHGVAAVENALGHAKPFTAPVPAAVYTFPEIGAVGLTEQEARDKGIPISIGKFPISNLGKAMATNHTEGFVKTIRHRETDAILGVHMIGHNATECIASAGALMHTGATMQEFSEVVYAHPTMSESLKESAEDALSAGLHLPPRKLIKVPLGV